MFDALKICVGFTLIKHGQELPMHFLTTCTKFNASDKVVNYTNFNCARKNKSRTDLNLYIIYFFYFYISKFDHPSYPYSH